MIGLVVAVLAAVAIPVGLLLVIEYADRRALRRELEEYNAEMVELQARNADRLRAGRRPEPSRGRPW